MTVNTESLVDTLNELIQTCEDGAEGFRKAAGEVEETSLKALFSEYAAQRIAFAEELRTAVSAHGGKPAESGHASGSLHRAWMTIKESIGNKDKAIIDECEAGEDRAMKAYREAAGQSLPAEVGELVRRQFAGVQEAHAEVRDLKHSRN